jgi:hypothetical protein
MTGNDMSTDKKSIAETSHRKEALAFRKNLLKQVDWLLPEEKSSILPLSSLGRGIQKIVRTLNPLKPTFLKLGPGTEVVFLTRNQYRSIQILKLAYARIIAEEERNIADADKEFDELVGNVKSGHTDIFE